MTQEYLDPFYDRLDEADLDRVFKTLHRQPYTLNDKRFKHKIDETSSQKNWLRMYAIRVQSNAYVITGGAIKLWKAMEEDIVTQIELTKIEMVKNFLVEERISDLESLEDYVLEISLDTI